MTEDDFCNHCHLFCQLWASRVRRVLTVSGTDDSVTKTGCIHQPAELETLGPQSRLREKWSHPLTLPRGESNWENKTAPCSLCGEVLGKSLQRPRQRLRSLPALHLQLFSVFPFPLQALYNQYIHFKETEIPAKQQEKRSIEELYKLLEVRKHLRRQEQLLSPC